MLLPVFASALLVASPPQAAPLSEPYAVVVEPRGTLLVADGGSGRIVRVDPRSARRTIFARGLGRVFDLAYGPGGLYASTARKVWRFTGGKRDVAVRGLHDAVGLAVSRDGAIYVTESSRNRVLRFAPRTPRRTVVVAAGLDQPIGVSVLGDGSLVVSDSHAGRVVRVGARGALTPVVEGLALPAGLKPAPGGGVFVVDHVRHDAFGKILVLRRDGTVETLSAGKIRAVTGIAAGAGGVRYVTSFERPFVGRLDASGALQPLGTNSLRSSVRRLNVRLLSPRIAFVNERWRVRVAYAGAVRSLSLVASQGSHRSNAPLHRSGSRWTGSLRLRRQGTWRIAVRTRRRTLSLGAITAGDHLRAPVKVEPEPGGTLLVADSGTGRILRLDPRTGVAVSLADRLTRLAAVAAGPSGTLFAIADEKLWRLERGSARIVAAFASEGPTDLAPRGDGAVYVARYGSHVDLVTPDGAVRPVADGFDRPHGITLLGDGSLLVADSYAGAVRRLAPDGGLTALATGLARPTDVAVARDGTLIVAEHDAGRISRIGTDGGVSTITAKLRGPAGLAVAADGALFAADVDGSAVFAVDPRTGFVTRVSR